MTFGSGSNYPPGFNGHYVHDLDAIDAEEREHEMDRIDAQAVRILFKAARIFRCAASAIQYEADQIEANGKPVSDAMERAACIIVEMISAVDLGKFVRQAAISENSIERRWSIHNES